MGEKQSIERRWEPIIPHIREFEVHLADHVAQLEILPANDRAWSWERYHQQNDTGIYRKYGVYLIFAPDEKLEYVGVAMNSFHDRIWSHDEGVNRRWTDVIPLAHEYYFIAPALEFFLICRLQPPKNSQYRRYTIPVHALRHKE